MKLRIIASIMVVMGVIAAFQFIGNDGVAGIVNGQASLSFWARCSGEQLIPPQDSSTKAVVELVKRNDAELWYKVRIKDVQGLRGVSIHTGGRNSNGPMAAVLGAFSLPPVSDANTFFDIAYSAKLTNADLQGDLRGGTIDDLIREMAAGNAYVLIRTAKRPDGEARGLILSSIGIGG